MAKATTKQPQTKTTASDTAEAAPVATQEPQKASTPKHPPMPPNRLTPTQALAAAKEAGPEFFQNGRVRVGKWLRETGTPAPLRLCRVNGRSKTGELPPHEVWAVDESEAIAQVVLALNITDTRAWNFRVTIIEE